MLRSCSLALSLCTSVGLIPSILLLLGYADLMMAQVPAAAACFIYAGNESCHVHSILQSLSPTILLPDTKANVPDGALLKQH